MHGKQNFLKRKNLWGQNVQNSKGNTTWLHKMYKKCSYTQKTYIVSLTILSIPLGPRLVLMASATAGKTRHPSYESFHIQNITVNEDSLTFRCSNVAHTNLSGLVLIFEKHPACYQLQNLHYLTSLALQALWLNFSKYIFTMQGFRRLTKRSKRLMITDCDN